MILICNVCVPKNTTWVYGDKGVLAIAKWYPAGFIGGKGKGAGAYYRNDGGKNMGKEFTDFLVEHEHQEFSSEHYKAGAGQENPIRLEYECIGEPILREEMK